MASSSPEKPLFSTVVKSPPPQDLGPKATGMTVLGTVTPLGKQIKRPRPITPDSDNESLSPEGKKCKDAPNSPQPTSPEVNPGPSTLSPEGDKSLNLSLSPRKASPLVNPGPAPASPMTNRSKQVKRPRSPTTPENIETKKPKESNGTPPPTSPSTNPKPSQTKNSAPNPNTVVWVTIVLYIVSDQTRSMAKSLKEQISHSFYRYMGYGHMCRMTDKPFTFKVRKDQLAKAKNFRHGRMEILIREINAPEARKTETKKPVNQTPNAQTTKGLINVGNKNWSSMEACRHYLQAAKNGITHFTKVIKQKGKDNMIKLTFNTNTMPLTITTADNDTYPVTPALYQAIRCNKCQRFGHPTLSCRANRPKCPHCAGPHTHDQCPDKRRKQCANCNGPHGAAYKGCQAYAQYTSHIAGINNEMTRKHNARVTHAPKPKLYTKDQVKDCILTVLKEIGQAPPDNLDEILEKGTVSATVADAPVTHDENTKESTPTAKGNNQDTNKTANGSKGPVTTTTQKTKPNKGPVTHKENNTPKVKPTKQGPSSSMPRTPKTVKSTPQSQPQQQDPIRTTPKRKQPPSRNNHNNKGKGQGSKPRS